MVLVRFQDVPRMFQRSCGPVQIARHQRDFSQRHRTARASNRFLAAECPCGALQQRLGSLQIAELRHGEAAKRQCRRVVAQGNASQRPEYVTCGEGTTRGGDQ